MAREFERRYEAYKREVVKPFFRNHFARIDRQVVLVDALSRLGVYTVVAALSLCAGLFGGLIGAFASLTYTAPPLKYKYSALGEISVFLMWGYLWSSA